MPSSRSPSRSPTRPAPPLSFTAPRLLLTLIVLGAGYVFAWNVRFHVDTMVVQLRAASQILIVVWFCFLIVCMPRLLPGQRGLVDRMIGWSVGFFILTNTLPLFVRLSRNTLDTVVTASNMTAPMLLLHHVFNIVFVPSILYVALLLSVRRACGSKKQSAALYWLMVLLGILGLAYISMTPTWTVM